MNSIHKMALFFLLLLALYHPASALTVCLNARSTNQITSGHSFVTIENGKQIIETYGFWPKDKYTTQHPGAIAINRSGDLPLAVLLTKKNILLAPDTEKMSENKLCQKINNNSLGAIRDTVLSYIEDHGKYQTLSNNCNHFAIHIYNSITGDTFKVVQTPLKTRKIIKEIYQARASSYTELMALKKAQ